MKIKVWALVLIILGSIAAGGLGMFAAMRGFSAVAALISGVRQARAVQIPGNWGYGQGSRDSGSQSSQLPADLPAGFNAGVNIESVYAGMTGRTAEQVQAAENEAGTDVWGLARKEGKLDGLRQQVQAAVEASLKQMVADGKITQQQSDSYTQWVQQYLKGVGQTNASGTTPGFGRSRRGQPMIPWATAQPGSAS